MTYEYIQNLKRFNKTLKLINSDTLAMSLSFFYYAFIEQKKSVLPYSKIVSLLDDYLFELNQRYNNLFPKSAKEYLDDFVSEKNGYLRKYHGELDEPLYELTPSTYKAIEFFESLEKREFVGSQSKFSVIIKLLEELEFETNLSDEERIEELKRQKELLDKKIKAIKEKRDLRFDSSRIKEHFMLIEEQARGLKYDFSQIEYNFRELNTLAMEEIAKESESKSETLSNIFDIEEKIRKSDQGKSFYSFWQLLTDAKESERFSALLQKLYEIDVIKDFDKERRLKGFKFELLRRGEKIIKVSAKLIEQLRRFIDERVWLENKRILELCKSIEGSALELKKYEIKEPLMSLPTASVKIDAVFEKKLFSPKRKNTLKTEIKEEPQEIDISSFYDIFFVDEEELKNKINTLLQKQNQVSIKELIATYPISKGVAELISYLSLAKKEFDSVIEERKVKVEIEDSNQDKKVVLMPNIIFSKRLNNE